MTADEAIQQLHNVARYIEQAYGPGILSRNVRDCADRLATLDEIDYPIHNEYFFDSNRNR